MIAFMMRRFLRTATIFVIGAALTGSGVFPSLADHSDRELQHLHFEDCSEEGIVDPGQGGMTKEEALEQARNFMPSGMCTTVMTEARHDATGAVHTFSSGCLPAGWTKTGGGYATHRQSDDDDPTSRPSYRPDDESDTTASPPDVSLCSHKPGRVKEAPPLKPLPALPTPDSKLIELDASESTAKPEEAIISSQPDDDVKRVLSKGLESLRQVLSFLSP